MALECSPEFLALKALLLGIVIFIRDMEYHSFDQSIAFLYNYVVTDEDIKTKNSNLKNLQYDYKNKIN